MSRKCYWVEKNGSLFVEGWYIDDQKDRDGILMIKKILMEVFDL